MLQPAVLATDPRYFRRVIVLGVLVFALVVAARVPIPELSQLPVLNLLLLLG